MTSATDELRRLLDERRVHWWAGEDEYKTLWESNGLTWEYFNDENGDVWLGFLGACEQDVSPEQAIAATLGCGECELTLDGTDGNFGCSKCLENIPPLANFCPNCGRKVKR